MQSATWLTHGCPNVTFAEECFDPTMLQVWGEGHVL